MDNITIYIVSTMGLILFMASWVSIRRHKNQTAGSANPFRSLGSVFVEMTVCSIGYSFFLFIVMLAVGVAIWLIVLGFVYIPADVYHSAYGGQMMENLVNKLTPYIHRTNNTPGLTGQPILDYCTLSVLVLAPVAGIWATFRKYKPHTGPDVTDPDTTGVGETGPEGNAATPAK